MTATASSTGGDDLLERYAREASVYEQKTRIFGQLYETSLGVLQRGDSFYPYIEDYRTPSTTIEHLGLDERPLSVAFAQRTVLGWETKMMRIDPQGYLHTPDRDYAIRWLEEWTTSNR